jgi:hypothetical protein
MLIAVALLAAGCGADGPRRAAAPEAAAAAPSPAAHEPPGLAEVRALVAAASRAYRVDPPAIMTDSHAGEATFGAVYRRGVILFTARILAGPSRDYAAAHEFAHYVLRHEHPSMRTPEEKEHQADIEAVRILQAGQGVSEEAAVRTVLQALARTRDSVQRGGPVARGHAHPCEEIRAVVAAYPKQRPWAASFECASPI